MIHKASLEEIPAYFQYYTGLVAENDLLEALKNSLKKNMEFYRSIPTNKENWAYAEGKWTIKQVLSHIIDTERIFAYRALRFSRMDSTELAGYDENWYADHVNHQEMPLAQFIEEYESVRKATLSLYQNMTDEMLDFKGRSNKMETTPRALGFMIVGHNAHHNQVIKTTYLPLFF